MKYLLNCFLIILLLQYPFGSVAQSCLDKIVDIEIPENPARMDETDPEYIEFMENTNCFLGEDLDTIDLEITTSVPYLGMLIMLENMMSESESPFTYGRLKQVIIDFTEKEEYPKIRELHLLSRDFSMKPAIYANWETDKHMLIDLGIPEETIEDFKNYLQENPDTGNTYEDMMIQYHMSKATTIED